MDATNRTAVSLPPMERAKINVATRPERDACSYRTKRDAKAVLHGYSGIAQ
jgi:hypothetical protein